MDVNFQSIVLIISVICLVILLVCIGIMVYRKRFSDTFPPTIATCPDYWEDVSNGSGLICKNKNPTKNILGKCGDSMDFSETKWTSGYGLCNKANWARNCNLTWDGITNNPSCLS